MWSLGRELSARERSVANKKHPEDVVVAKETLTEQIKQLSALVTELKGKVEKDINAISNRIIRLNA